MNWWKQQEGDSQLPKDTSTFSQVRIRTRPHCICKQCTAVRKTGGLTPDSRLQAPDVALLWPTILPWTAQRPGITPSPLHVPPPWLILPLRITWTNSSPCPPPFVVCRRLPLALSCIPSPFDYPRRGPHKSATPAASPSPFSFLSF